MSQPPETPHRSLPPLHSGAPSTQPAASYSPYRHYQSPSTMAEPPFQLTRVGSFSARLMSPAPYSDITQPFPALQTHVNPYDEGAVKAAKAMIMAIDALFYENFFSPFGSVEEALVNDTEFMDLANPDSSERRWFNLTLSDSHAELATHELTKWKNRSSFHRENITNLLRESEKCIEERRKLRQELIRKIIKAGGDWEEAQHRLNMQRGGGALEIAQQVDQAVDEGFVIVRATGTERPNSGLTLPFVRSVFNRYKDRLREVKPKIIYKQLFLHQHTPSKKKEWHNILLAMSDNDWHRNQHVQKHIQQLKDIGYMSKGFAPRGVQTNERMSEECMKDLVCEVYLCLPTDKPGGFQGLRLVPSTSGGTHVIQNPNMQAEAEMAPATVASPAENAALFNTESQVAVQFNQGTQPAPSPTQVDVGQKPPAVAYKQGEAQPLSSAGVFNTKPQATVQFNQGIQKAPPPTQFDTAAYKQGGVQPAPLQFNEGTTSIAENTADTTGSLFGGTAASGNTNTVLFGGFPQPHIIRLLDLALLPKLQPTTQSAEHVPH